MKKTLLALLLAAGGCASPNWKEPEMDQSPIVIEEAPREKPRTRKEATTTSPEAKNYVTIEMSVAYQFGSGTAARTYDGLVKRIEKDQGDKPLSDYEHMIIAFKANKDGNVSSSDASNLVASYSIEKGTKETKIPVVAVNEDNLKRAYTEIITAATEEVAVELRKMIDEKGNAEKAKLAEAVRSVYGGQNPLPIGPKQMEQIKVYQK